MSGKGSNVSSNASPNRDGHVIQTLIEVIAKCNELVKIVAPRIMRIQLLYISSTGPNFFCFLAAGAEDAALFTSNGITGMALGSLARVVSSLDLIPAASLLLSSGVRRGAYPVRRPPSSGAAVNRRHSLHCTSAVSFWQKSMKSRTSRTKLAEVVLASAGLSMTTVL